MSIDIAKLKKLVEESLKDGRFNLDTAKLESPGITVIATACFPKATLALSGANISSSDEHSITVRGKGTVIPFSEMEVLAKFYMLEESAALTMQASGNPDWLLSQSFPELKGTLGSQVKFTQSIFWLLSDPELDKPVGLTFEGLIDFAASSDGISKILAVDKEALNGKITLKEGGTKLIAIDLAGPVIKDVNLWVSSNTDITFGLKSEMVDNPATHKGIPLPMMYLTASVPFSEGKYHLPLSVRITDLESFVRFGADMTEVINTSLDTLSSFIGGADLAKTIPKDFHIEEYVRFTSLFVDFDITGAKVDMIGLQVDSTSPWKIFTVSATGKTFTASDVSLRFNVLTPFSGSKPSVFMGGKISLTEKASLYVSAGYPNFEVQGYLTEDSELNIREFVENFVGKASGIPENLWVEELGFDLQAGNYSFEIGIDGYWPINQGQNISLSIDELGFSVAHNEAETTASFNGTLRINTVDVYVTANYNADSETSGWLFTGETGKGQRIQLGEFTSYLAKTFNAPPPPAWMSGFSLQDLSTSFNTQNKDFSFFITGNIPVAAKKEYQLTVGFEMKSLPEGGYQRKLSGSLNVGKSIFKIVGTTTPSDSSISAQWNATETAGYLQFEDIAHAFGMDNVPAIPDKLNLALKEAKLYYDFTEGKQALLIAAESVNYGTAVFAAKKTGEAWTYVIGVNMKINITLAQLPLVGDDLEKIAGPSGLNGFKLVATTKKIEGPLVEEFNTLIKEHGGEAYPQLPEVQGGIEPGVYCALELQLGKENKFEVQVATAGKKQALLPSAETAGSSANAYWVDLQKTIGPLYFDRAGITYRDGRVALLLDASLVFTALKIDLIQLGVSNPLNEFKPDFELAGLNIAFKSGPVQISGGFLKQVVDGVTEYNGSAVIGIKAFSLSALGSYASKDGHPSLFIFALMTAPPLGGDPAFFITGLAGGFGYNRGLKLPTIDTVSKFPLTAGFVPGQSGPFSGPDPGKALKVLVEERVVPVQIGQNWLAAGIRFTTYELLESFALLSVAFGTDLEIGLIGLSTLSVPSKSPKVIASAQLAINVQILPNKGVVSVEAKLTPASYILSQSCLLTGGFAFYLWTSPNEHEGDFVITLGGYHPNFTPPGHYPKVPRLGFNWRVTSEVSMKGGIYFALTPSCVMAGGSLEATFQSGSLKAWFIIGADFIISWKPYYYDARLYASFGVSYTFRLNLLFTTITKTISVSLGADLRIWGPEFSGIARIHLWIISFDISFGANSTRPAMNISWKEFKDSFLPPSQQTLEHERLYGNTTGVPVPTDTYCIGRITSGLVKDQTTDTPKDPISWIVNRDNVTLETNAVIPAKDYELIIRDKNGNIAKENIIITNAGELANINKDFGVGMVDVTNEAFRSKQVVTLEFEGELHPKVRYEVTAIIRNVPKSLWDKRQTGLVKDATVKNVLTGFRITPVSPVPQQSLPVALENFQYDYDDYAHIIKPAKPTFIDGPENKDGMQVMKETINNEKVKATRLRIVERLSARGVSVNKEINVEQIARSGEDFIMAPPVLKYEYWKA